MLNKKFHLETSKFYLGIALVFMMSLSFSTSSSWAVWTIDVTVDSDHVSLDNKQLTLGTDIGVPNVETDFEPFPPPDQPYLEVAIKDPIIPFKYYSTYTDADGPWLIRVYTNHGFELGWDGLDGIDDGLYHVSIAEESDDNPRKDWGLLRSQSSHFEGGNYFILITKVEASTRTASIVSNERIAFQGDDLSTGAAIELVSGSEGDVTVTRTDAAPVGVNPNFVLPQNWEVISGLTGIEVKLRFYYLDADIPLGIDEAQLKLAYKDNGIWRILGAADIEEHNTAGSAGYFQTVEMDHLSTWAIGVEDGFAPQIDTITLDYGSTEGGDEVTITGTNFGATQGAGSVTFDGISATSYISWSDVEIVCETPAHAAGLVDVVVTADNGLSGTLSSGFDYIPPPEITGIDPAYGLIDGGTAVTITGLDFEPAQGTGTVTFDGIEAVITDPADWTDTQIKCLTPAHAAGNVDVVVTTDKGYSYTEVDGNE
jgi:hypothetical protein